MEKENLNQHLPPIPRFAHRVLDAFYEHTPYFITSHHLQSYNDFIGRQLRVIIASMNEGFAMVDKGRVERDGEVDPATLKSIHVWMGGDAQASGIYMDKPTLVDTSTGTSRYLFPNEARLRGMTYASNLYCDVRLVFKVGDTTVGERLFPRHRIGLLPIMLHSNLCALNHQPAALLREMGECPYDQGGYFVIGGGEKVLVAQELPVYNRLFVSPGPAPEDVAFEGKVRCVEEEGESLFSKTVTFLVYANNATRTRNTIDVRFPGMDSKAKLPLFLLFRVFGLESDKEIIDLILDRKQNSRQGEEGEGDDDDRGLEAMLDILRSCAMAAAKTGAFDQLSATKVIMNTGKKGMRTLPRLKQVLAKDVFPNAGRAFKDKAVYLAFVVGKLLRVATGVDEPTNRDTYEHKRVMVSGRRLGFLFRDQYRIFRKEAMNRLDFEYLTGPWKRTGVSEGDIKNLVNAANVSHIFDPQFLDKGISSAFRGAWNIDLTAPSGKQEEYKEEGVVQELARISYLAYVSHVRRVAGGADVETLRAPHFLYGTQWGVVCPVESPDGLNIGITKHLATLCHVTGTLDPKPLLHHLRQLGLLRPDDSSSSQQLKKKSRVIVNDILRGVTLRPLEMERYLLALRRNGLLHPHISITWDVLSREFRVATSGGRCTRPLFIVDHTGPVEQPGGTSRPGWMRAADKPIDRWDWRTMVLGTLLTQQEKDAIMPSTTGFSHDTLFVHTLEGDDDTRGGRAKKVPPASAAANAANAANAERYFAKGEGDVVAATERLAVTAGVVEFVDVEEASSRLVAVAPQDLEVRPCQHYTHCEIHPSTILGIPASCIPFMDRNQAPRNVLSMSQSKQSVGVSVTNLDNRMDTMSAVLHYPQRPLVTTSSAHRLMGGNLAYGENLVVAIASFTGYNQEDAVILNRDSVMRGCFSVTHLHTLKFEESVEGNERVLIAHPLLRTDVETVSEMEAEEEKRYASLDKDGLPVVGAQVREGDALLGMVHVSRVVRMERDTIGLSHVVENEVHTDCTERVDRSSRGTVDRVFRHASSAEDGGTKCKVRVRQVREPELGDKCASRHGQKGVVGMLVPAIDMPYGATSGLVPDIVINPNAFPKRMTVGHLMEALLSKACVVAGRRVSCDTFERADVLGTAEDVLEQGHGMHRHSDEIMYNGRTGEQIATSVFLAPTYYMRLKHMVADKINHRSTGPHTAITRQPTQGRGKHGGLRVGEMEHQALLSHGASGFLKESFMERSDGHYMDLDVDAGVPVRISSRVRGEEDGMRMRLLAHDEDDVDIRRVRVPYAFKLMHQEVQALGVDMRMLVAADVAEGEDDALPRIHNRVLNLLQHTSCSQL